MSNNAAAAHGERKIGFWTCTALVIGNVIGMGIFVLPASLAPYGFNALIGWGIVLAGCLVLARVFSQLAQALPDVGGPYGYISHTLGRLTAYLALWSYWVSVWLTNSALATGVVGYLVVVFPPLAALPPMWFAQGLLCALVAVNLCGVRSSGGMQILTTVLKLLPMLAIALLGGWVLLTSPASYTAHLPATPITLGGVTAASTIALFAMIGIESASVPAARVDDPARTIPRSTMVGAILTAAIYIVVSAVPLLLIRQQELADASAPFALLMERYAVAGSGRWLALFVAISGLGALNGWTLLVGELTCTMAGNGVLPAVLARHNRQGTPVVALLVTGALASAMIAMSYSKSLVSAFTFLTRVGTAASLPLYLCCGLALAVLWRRRNAACATRRTMIVASVCVLFVVFAFVGTGREPFLYALGLIAAGLPLYALMRLRRHAGPTIGVLPE
ncbi:MULTISPECIES: APC family permease [Rhodanobacter]|uniref:Arginine/agmatine antiporter n=1 Tax=Rhodanobacter hydrolyticus TaxID=2250595 RepID=A0ABW8JBR4_9GAMM|nr:amino acid permease [Rhodanobacter sp. 7MK24]MBD8880603.1 amino acid permease [Rhodanobacter sp. 7MK24]